ncbi:hypothetical protein OAC89_04380 [Deltaproteobacteria bacterium]|nr:hypothetical protein [Deltaproteobacteria bacterium]
MDESSGCWRVLFLTKYRLGLFSDITGVIALNNINVLSAEIQPRQGGELVEIKMKTSPLGKSDLDETWGKVKEDLTNTFTGKLALPYRLNLRVLSSNISILKNPSHISNVILDNELSKDFTVINVFAEDKVGLLYRIIRTLTDLRIAIRNARILTNNEQVADEFYVSDLEKRKIEDRERIK